jgi:hypothetical protein
MADLPAGGSWVTLNGARVYIDSGGKVIAGAGGALKGSPLGGAKASNQTAQGEPTASSGDFVKEGRPLSSMDYADRAEALAATGYDKEVAKYKEMPLSREDRDLVEDFTGFSYNRHNSKLRQDPREIEDDKEIQGLQRVVQSAPPLAEDTLLFRHLNTPAHLDPYAGIEEGTIHELHGFASTSSVSQAQFLQSQGVTMQIRAAKGSKGILSGFNKSEQEYLFGHKARLKLVGKGTVTYKKNSAESFTNKTYFFEYEG